MKKYIIWIICIFSFFSASFYSELNLNNLPKKLKRDNTTVITNDDYSYLNPAETYLKTGEWKQEGKGIQPYFLRAPGYGYLYFICSEVSDSPLSLLKFLQTLLFALSVYWVFSITNCITQQKTISLITASTYGLTPFAVGFISYTLTEGITPPLVLIFVHLLLIASNKKTIQTKQLFYLLASVSFAILLISRPALGLLGILLPIFIIKDFWNEGAKKTVQNLIICGTIAFSLLTAWQIRNYNIAYKYVAIHAIYYPDNNSIYRPTFKEYWNFVGGWAQEGAIAHSYMVPMWNAAIKGDTSEIFIKNALATFPKRVLNHFGEQRLTQLFKKYQKATLFQKRYYDKKLPMPEYTPEIELELINELKTLTQEYKSTFWFEYHIGSPLKVFKTMSLHSNLSLYIFQHTYRGNILMEMFRFLFFGLHTLCFLGLIINLFFLKKNNWKTTTISLTTFIYLFYLCYFQRGIEERYTLPILALLMIGLAQNINLLIKFYKKNKLKSR